MTFAIAARCARTGRFAVAVSSSSPAVAARCAHARAGVGAAASQNVTDPALGPRLLDLMASGMAAPEAMAALRREAAHLDYRQLAAIGRDGRTAGFSGRHTLGTHAVAEGVDAVAAGNLLSIAGVPAAMVAAFAADPAADLGDRAIAAMRAGLAAGGEESPVRSAGLLVVDRVAWPVADLRVDWHDDPIAELARLWDLWKPQLEDYVTRALDPAAAPSFGVAGDR
ncbi:MAG TPA: DUF1028 domain-containing protein [Hyphomicrobiales bacterium]|nr:DUF1028 domain-containing protein [Hyphomicrobiales bacterium]